MFIPFLSLNLLSKRSQSINFIASERSERASYLGWRKNGAKNATNPLKNSRRKNSFSRAAGRIRTKFGSMGEFRTRIKMRLVGSDQWSAAWPLGDQSNISRTAGRIQVKVSSNKKFRTRIKMRLVGKDQSNIWRTPGRVQVKVGGNNEFRMGSKWVRSKLARSSRLLICR